MVRWSKLFWFAFRRIERQKAQELRQPSADSLPHSTKKCHWHFLAQSRGQAVFESIMLMLIFALVTQGALKVIRSQNYFQTAFGDPWGKLKNIIQYGVEEENKDRAKGLHPANFRRHQTKRPRSS